MFMKMHCCKLWIVLYILCLETVYDTKAKKYIYVNDSMSWESAIQYCRQNVSAELSSLNVNHTVIMECVGSDSPLLWTSQYSTLSPLFSYEGCFSVMEHWNFEELEKESVADCQFICRNFTYFANSGMRCFCFSALESSMSRVDASYCDIVCQNQFYCGGSDYITLYSTVDEAFKDNNSISTNSTTPSCLSYECKDNDIILKENNCNSTSFSTFTCASYLTCTFEKKDQCFLYPVDNNAYMSIEGQQGALSAYEGQFYALFHAPYRFHKTTLISNTILEGNWCLRFRYRFTASTEPKASIKIMYMQGSSKQEKDFTWNGGPLEQWYFAQLDITMDSRDKVQLVMSVGEDLHDNVTIDDVSLISGNCGKTMTKLLYMKRYIRCDYEGKVDVCFDQDEDRDDFQWKIQEGSTRTDETGPSRAVEGLYYNYIEVTRKTNGNIARLISKFDFKEGTIQFTMSYHMYGRDTGRLNVFLRDRGNKEVNIFNKNGNQNDVWHAFAKNITVRNESKLIIEASRGDGHRGDIAIDNIMIRVLEETSFNWGTANRYCVEKVGSYLLGFKDLPKTCLYDSIPSMVGVIQFNTLKNVYNASHLSKPVDIQSVKVVDGVGFKFVWHKYNTNTSQAFICEIENSEDNEACVIEEKEQKESNELPFNDVKIDGSSGLMAGVAGGISVLVTIGLIVVGIILFKRYNIWMQRSRNNGKGKNIPGIINSSYDLQETSDIILCDAPKGRDNSNEINPYTNIKSHKSPQNGQLNVLENSENIYANESKASFQNASEDTYDHTNRNVSSENLSNCTSVEDTYDHMHANTNEDKNYGYDKTFISCASEDAYDHTNMVTQDNPEEEYSVPSRINMVEDTYDHTS